jgi:hypothetical protein
MGDGDRVMEHLITKTATDPVLARNIELKIPDLGTPDANKKLREAIEKVLGRKMLH